MSTWDQIGVTHDEALSRSWKSCMKGKSGQLWIYGNNLFIALGTKRSVKNTRISHRIRFTIWLIDTIVGLSSNFCHFVWMGRRISSQTWAWLISPLRRSFQNLDVGISGMFCFGIETMKVPIEREEKDHQEYHYEQGEMIQEEADNLHEFGITNICG